MTMTFTRYSHIIFDIFWGPCRDFHTINPNFDASAKFAIGIGLETDNSIIHQTPNSISIWSIILALMDTQAGGGVVLIGIGGIDVWIYGLPFAPVYVCAWAFLLPVHVDLRSHCGSGTVTWMHYYGCIKQYGMCSA